VNARIRLVASTVALAAALVFVRSFSHGETIPLRRPLAEFPIDGWTGRESTELGERELEQLKLTDYLFRRYEDPAGDDLWLYLGYWETQRRGAQIHSPKHCLPGGGWEPLDAGRVQIATGAGPIEANRFVLQRESARMIALYWYESQGTAVASEFAAKWLLVRNSIGNRRSDGALVRLTAPVRGSVRATEAKLLRFAAAMHGALPAHLPD
jgi:EpsI family protein